MTTRQIQAGTTDVSVIVRIIDSSDGTPENGVVYNTSGIDLWYRREGAASVDITEATLAALTTAHTDGGFLHINDGWYRLDLPDAACAAGVTGVQIGGTVTGMVVLAPFIELVAYDPYDSVRLGLTSLPNAAADAAGGLPISDSGGLDLDTLFSNIAAILVDTGTTLDDLVDDLESRLGTPGDLGGGATIAGNLADMAGATFSTATDSQEAIRNRGDAAWLTATGFSTHSAADVWAAATRTLTASTNFNDISAGDVLTQVNAAIDTAISELGVGAPTATPTLRTGLMLLYMMARNRVDVDTTGTDEMKIYNNAGTQIASKAITDDGTDYSEAEMA